MKELAIEEILKIYREDYTTRKEIIEALGEVGGRLAIKEILKIYREDYRTRKNVILALGQASKSN